MKIVGAYGLGDLIARSEPSLAGSIAAWYAEVSAADWSCDADVALRHLRAILKSGSALFDLGQDDYCVIIQLNYEMQSVLMKYIGPRANAPWMKPRARKSKTAT